MDTECADSYVDITSFAAFAEHKNLRPALCSFATGIRMRSDLQQATPQRDGDCMRPIVGLKVIHQVRDVEVNRVSEINPGAREASRHVRRNIPPANVNRLDHFYNSFFGMLLSM